MHKVIGLEKKIVYDQRYLGRARLHCSVAPRIWPGHLEMPSRKCQLSDRTVSLLLPGALEALMAESGTFGTFGINSLDHMLFDVWTECPNQQNCQYFVHMAYHMMLACEIQFLSLVEKRKKNASFLSLFFFKKKT